MTSPFKIVDDIKLYDFNKSLAFLEKMGKSRYGDQFRLHKEDREVVYKLLIYAIRDEENCKKHKIDLNKGILLTDPVGCGKTSLMTLIKFFTPPEHGHQIIRRHTSVMTTSA